MFFQRLVRDSDIDSNGMCYVGVTVGENHSLINADVSLLEKLDMTPVMPSHLPLVCFLQVLMFVSDCVVSPGNVHVIYLIGAIQINIVT